MTTAYHAKHGSHRFTFDQAHDGFELVSVDFAAATKHTEAR